MAITCVPWLCDLIPWPEEEGEKKVWELMKRYAVTVGHVIRQTEYSPGVLKFLSWDGVSYTSRTQSPAARSPQQWMVMNSQFLNPSIEWSKSLKAKKQKTLLHMSCEQMLISLYLPTHLIQYGNCFYLRHKDGRPIHLSYFAGRKQATDMKVPVIWVIRKTKIRLYPQHGWYQLVRFGALGLLISW